MSSKKLTRKEKQLQTQEDRAHQKIAVKASVSTDKLARLLALIVTLFALFLYFNTLNYGYTLDDFSVIKENSIVNHGMKSIPAIFKSSYRQGYMGMNDGLYRPLSLAMFAIEWELYPDGPWFGHLMNILIYALTAYLLFRLLTDLMKGYNLVFPFIIALLFVAHPIHTEVAASIKSRDEMLCFLFSILSLKLLLVYIKKYKIVVLITALLCLFLALLSKETAITMLAIIPLSLFCFTKSDSKKIIVSTAYFLMPAVLFLLIRHFVLAALPGGDITLITGNVLATAPDYLTRLATAFHVLGDYLKLLVFPNQLLCDYSFSQIALVKWDDLLSIVSLVVYTGIGVYALIRIRSKDIAAYGILFYLITISLFSNILILIGTAMAERFVYFSSLGFCIALAAILMKLTKTEVAAKAYENFLSLAKQNTFIISMVLVILVLYSFKTIDRNKAWKDDYTLYTTDAAVSTSYHLHYFLGRQLTKVNARAEQDSIKRLALFRQGIQELEESVRINPTYADGYSQIGVAYSRIDDYPNAIKYFKIALKYAPEDVIVLNNLAAVYASQNNFTETLNTFKHVVEINPLYSAGHINLGTCYALQGNFEEAIVSFTKALQLEPNNAKVLMELSSAYNSSGNKQQAELYYNKAIQIDPSLKK